MVRLLEERFEGPWPPFHAFRVVVTHVDVRASPREVGHRVGVLMSEGGFVEEGSAKHLFHQPPAEAQPPVPWPDSLNRPPEQLCVTTATQARGTPG